MELSKKRSSLEQKFYELSSEIVKSSGLELYDMEYNSGQSLLRVFIIDPQTKSAELDDCVKVDRAFSEPCEELEWIPDSLVLEVSSPGVYRNLKTVEHFETAIGELVSCTISGKLSDQQVEVLPKKLKKAKKFRGILNKVTEENIIIEIDGNELELNYGLIKKAHLDPELIG